VAVALRALPVAVLASAQLLLRLCHQESRFQERRRCCHQESRLQQRRRCHQESRLQQRRRCCHQESRLQQRRRRLQMLQLLLRLFCLFLCCQGQHLCHQESRGHQLRRSLLCQQLLCKEMLGLQRQLLCQEMLGLLVKWFGLGLRQNFQLLRQLLPTTVCQHRSPGLAEAQSAGTRPKRQRTSPGLTEYQLCQNPVCHRQFCLQKPVCHRQFVLSRQHRGLSLHLQDPRGHCDLSRFSQRFCFQSSLGGRHQEFVQRHLLDFLQLGGR
jgi:hypothetical protein